MDKKLLSLIILLFGIFSTLSAQEDNRITIKGVVVDATTGEPIPFANLGVLGTVAGVASDMDGNFELLLPLSLEKYKVRVSVVGYTSYEMNVEDVKGEENMRIALKPVTYGIGEVDVYAESLVKFIGGYYHQDEKNEVLNMAFDKLVEWPVGCVRTMEAKGAHAFFELCGELVKSEPRPRHEILNMVLTLIGGEAA